MTNLEFARRTAHIAKRASEWSFDTLTMGDKYMHQPTINNSVERFCEQIEGLLELIRKRDEAA